MNWIWSIRSGDGGMNGLEFATALTAGDLRRVLVHAAPGKAQIEVNTVEGEKVAAGRPEREGEYSPITELLLDERGGISREEIWPDEGHVGLPVILPRGEVGVLTSWRHAEDHSWWQWSVEFSNHKERPDDWSPPDGKLRR